MENKSLSIIISLIILSVSTVKVSANDLYCRPQFKQYYDESTSGGTNIREMIFKESDFKSYLAYNGDCIAKEHVEGNSIKAYMACPYNIKRMQLRPLLLWALKTLIRKHHNASNIDIKIVPEDMQLTITRGNNLYEAELIYRENANPDYTKRTDGYSTLTFYYGIPSPSMIKEYNAVIGKPTCVSIFGKALDYKNNYPPLHTFTEKQFNLAKRAYLLFNSFSSHNSSANEDAIYKRVSYVMSKPIKEIKQLIYQIQTYYSAGQSGWGQEYEKIYVSDLRAL